ncbi:CHRD domain-containing protein [Noviherbaspirillum sp. L7-7A]|uniref:CHRD domain-containing protein n=1 Tax=Noviherbaspirillum sp. L7-7A TaxID=2850560 RepID=UPI001C2BBA33|nr:CHRD domain-containing protein [Noviherbaspirillum sp. L7-7A]MBV0882164.1 CHRD domain-containing protein [Noviherbaspirillum sp. L7-7A]
MFFGLFATAGASQALTYTAQLSCPNESPPVASPGTGFAIVDFDATAHTSRVNETFSGLLGNTTASHIHCCLATPCTGNAGVATQVPTFVGFQLGVTAGAHDNTFNTLVPATWNQAFITANGGTAAGAEAALAAGLGARTAYINIHKNLFPAGEIRGFLTQATSGQVPEPGSMALVAIAFGALATSR